MFYFSSVGRQDRKCNPVPELSICTDYNLPFPQGAGTVCATTLAYTDSAFCIVLFCYVTP